MLKNISVSNYIPAAADDDIDEIIINVKWMINWSKKKTCHKYFTMKLYVLSIFTFLINEIQFTEKINFFYSQFYFLDHNFRFVFYTACRSQVHL